MLYTLSVLQVPFHHRDSLWCSVLLDVLDLCLFIIFAPFVILFNQYITSQAYTYEIIERLCVHMNG